MTNDPKAKSTVQQKNQEQPTDLNRVLDINQGTEVIVKGQKYVVKDLKLMDCIVLATKCADIFSIFVNSGLSTDIEPHMFLTLLSYIPDVRGKLGAFFAVCCGDESKQDEFTHLEDDELIELLQAIKKEVDFARIKENFTKLNLAQLMGTSTEKSE